MYEELWLPVLPVVLTIVVASNKIGRLLKKDSQRRLGIIHITLFGIVFACILANVTVIYFEAILEEFANMKMKWAVYLTLLTLGPFCYALFIWLFIDCFTKATREKN